MPYEVRTPVFEGPFDLLLHLILRQEVDLWELSLATIVDAYLAEVETMESLDLEMATEFLLIAATLIELKARWLLPAPESADFDEELLRFEERDLLLARLLDCKTFKDAADVLAARMRAAARSLPRLVGPEEPYRSLCPDPLERVSVEQLRRAARSVLAPRPVEVVNTDHIAPIRASVRDAVDTVLGLLPVGEAVTFREVVGGVHDRLEIIVRFLAVLELLKQGLVDLEQATTFGELRVRRLSPNETVLDAGSLGEWDEEPDDPRSSRKSRRTTGRE